MTSDAPESPAGAIDPVPWSAHALPPLRAEQLTGVSMGPDPDRMLIRRRNAFEMLDTDGRRLWTAAGAACPDVGWLNGGSDVLVAVDGRLRVLEAETGKAKELPGSLAALADVCAFALSPDHSRLAAGTGDATGNPAAEAAVLIADLASGTARRLRGVVDPVVGLTWINRSAVAVVTPHTVQLWNADTSVLIRSVAVDGDQICALAFSAVNSLLAVAERGGVRVIEMTGDDRATWVPLDAPADLAFTRSQSLLLAGSVSGVRALTREGGTVTTLPGRVIARGQIAVSRSGLIALRADSGTVAPYEPTDLEPRVLRRYTAPRRWAATMGRTVGRAQSADASWDPPTTRETRIVAAVPGSRTPAFAWAPDGGWFAATAAGRLARFHAGADAPLWECPVDPVRHVYEVVVSADGGRVAAAAINDTPAGGGAGNVAVVSGDGAPVRVLKGGQSPVFDPSGKPRLAVPRDGPVPNELIVYDLIDGHIIATRPVLGIGRITWSPDGSLLAAAAGGGRVVIWQTSDWSRVQAPTATAPSAVIARIAWSPDGRYLAVTPTKGGGPVTVLETDTWQPYQTFDPPGGRDWAPALGWSPDSRLLLFPMANPNAATVGVWDVSEGRLLRSLNPPGPVERTAEAWTVAWAPDGQTIAISYSDGRIAHFLLEEGPVQAAKLTPLRYPPSLLARLGGACAEAGTRIPLSLQASLLALTGGEPVPELAPLTAHRTVRVLSGFRWPAAARIGMVAMLAARLAGQDSYAPPPGQSRGELAAALHRVLTATPVRPSTPPVPFGELTSALESVEESTLTLLSILGPEAVAADPCLPVRLCRTIRNLSPLSLRQRRLLDVRLFMADGGMADGRAAGGGRSGLSRHGDVNRLLPSQFALDDDVFKLRQVRDELLYRTRDGRLPPGPRAMILLLDDTPAALGAVGITLRTCAHLLAATMIRRSRPCAMVRLGKPAEPRFLAHQPDLIQLWTDVSLGGPQLDGAAATVATLTRTLTTESAEPPWVLLLTHPHQPAPPLPGLRAIRVQYPGQTVSFSGGYSLAPDPDSGALYGTLISVLTDADQQRTSRTSSAR